MLQDYRGVEKLGWIGLWLRQEVWIMFDNHKLNKVDQFIWVVRCLAGHKSEIVEELSFSSFAEIITSTSP